MACFYPDGPGAAALLAATKDAMKTRGTKLSVKAAYAQGTNKVPNAAVDAFITATPQAIILVASGSAASAFIEKYLLEGGAAQLFAQSGADIEQISQRLGEEHFKGPSITQVTPNPYKISGRLNKEFNEAVAAAPNLEVPASYAMMEGCITGDVILGAVRHMGPKSSREGFGKVLDSIDNLDLAGYRVGFKPGMRSGSKFVELTIIMAASRVRQ